MMTDLVRPIIYLKRTCPFCLKLRIFLTEAAIADSYDFVVFADGDEMHKKLRARMEAVGQEPNFPAAELVAGTLDTGTDDLIARLSADHNVDPTKLPLLAYYSEGVFPRYIEMFRELGRSKAGQ